MNDIIQKKVELEAPLYYMKHLQIISAFLNKDFTKKEREVLGFFMSLEGPLGQDRFGTTSRKEVMVKLKLSPGGLGNYLKAFERKKFIYKDAANNFKIAEYLIPNEKRQGYQLRLDRKF